MPARINCNPSGCPIVPACPDFETTFAIGIYALQRQGVVEVQIREGKAQAYSNWRMAFTIAFSILKINEIPWQKPSHPIPTKSSAYLIEKIGKPAAIIYQHLNIDHFFTVSPLEARI